MGRAIFGLLLGFTIVFAVAYWSRTCLPDPNDKGIEWLRREDVIVVQMKTVEPASDSLRQRLAVPEFTLYGAGTLLFTDPGRPDSKLVFQAAVSDSTTRSILKELEDIGFSDLGYAESSAGTVDGAATYIYAKTLLGANAIVLRDSDANSGDEEKLTSIRSHLLSIAEDHLQRAQDYNIESILQVSRKEGAEGLEEQVHTGDDAERLSEIFTIGKGTGYVTIPEGGDGKLVEGGYRPILPYEENFPEFDPPTQ